LNKLAATMDKVIDTNAKIDNMQVAEDICSLVKTSLGPLGASKLIINAPERFTITGDGFSIMKNISSDAPAAKIIRGAAEAQKNEVGDGVKTTLILIGQLLANANKLIHQIHQNIIIRGYDAAANKSIEVLESLAVPFPVHSDEALEQVAATAITSRSLLDVRKHFAEIAVRAVRKVAEGNGGEAHIDPDRISTIKKIGGSLLDTELVNGLALRKNASRPWMVSRVEKAKIAVVGEAIKASLGEKSSFGHSEITLKDAAMAKIYLNKEEAMLRDMVTKIVSSGANVVFCQKGIDERAEYMLDKNGVMVVANINEDEMEKIVAASGCKPVGVVDDLTPSVLGQAEVVERRKIEGEEILFLLGCREQKSITIFVRGPEENVVDEAEVNLIKAVKVASKFIGRRQVIPGGGASEIEIEKEVRRYAKNFPGAEQLAIEAFADSVRNIAAALSESAGMDPRDTVAALRSRHVSGERFVGINLVQGVLGDMVKLGIVEPPDIKVHAFKVAKEVVRTLLRVDASISKREREVARPKVPKAPPPEKKEEGIPVVVEKTEEEY